MGRSDQMNKMVLEDKVIFKVGDKIGKLTLITIDDKTVTVQCDCGNIAIYKSKLFHLPNSPRQCFKCVKTNMQKFNLGAIDKSKYPPLDEDVSNKMIANFIKGRNE